MADDSAVNNSAPAAPQTSQQSTSTTSTDGVAAQAAAIVADPNASTQQKVAAVKKLNSLKIKVDGQEYNESLPFEIDPSNKDAVEYMRKHLQMSKAGQKRMGEKAQLENEVRSFLDQLKKNPKALLSDPTYGVDLKKLAAEMIEEELSNASKSPEQLAKEGLERELESLKAQRKAEKEQYDQREFERIQQSEYERYDSLMTQTLEKSDLPKSPYVVKKMADYMLMGLKEGLDISPEDVLPLVRDEILDDIRQMAQAMPLETIEKLFGGDILTKIRKKNVAKAKSAPAVSNNASKLPDVGATKAAKTEVDPKKKMTIKQLFGV